jgi:hypothetical protein
MRNIKYAGIRGKIYKVYVFLGRIICSPSDNHQGDLVIDGDTIKVDNKQFKVKLTERKDCSIKKIEFIAV